MQEPPGAHFIAPSEGRRGKQPKKERGDSYPTRELQREDLSEYTTIKEVSGDAFVNKPVKQMLYSLAKDHIVNCTGYWDWNEKAAVSNAPPEPISGKIFIDTIIVRLFIPDYHVAFEDGKHKLKSEAASYIRSKIMTIFERNDCTALDSGDIKLVRGVKKLADLPPKVSGNMFFDESSWGAEEACAMHRLRQDSDLLLRLRAESQAARDGDPNSNPLVVVDQTVAWESETTEFFVQYVKIQPCNDDGARVVDLVHRGELANLGFYIEEIDVSREMAFSFRKYDVIEHLLSTGDFAMQKDSGDECNDTAVYEEGFDCPNTEFSPKNLKGIILQNDSLVGRNCISVMRCSGGKYGPNGSRIRLPERAKAYIKLVSNLEQKARDQDDVGWHGLDNAVLCFDRVSRSLILPIAQQQGFVRLENTLYIKGVQPDTAHLYSFESLERAAESLAFTASWVPPELCLHLPHKELWEFWCRQMQHVLVAVHPRYDRAILVYTLNEVTGKLTGIPIDNWSRYYRFVLESCAVGKLPVDVITIHTGRDVPMDQPDNPRRKRKSRALSKEEKARRKRVKMGVQDIREAFMGISKRGDAHGVPCADADSESEEEEEDGDEDGEEEMAQAPEISDETSVTATSTAAADDQTRYDYKPGWMQPEDPLGATITSQRLFRAPKTSDQLEDDGSFFPATRILGYTVGKSFSPSGNKDIVFHGREGEEPWALKPGWNGDGTHVEDVGNRLGRLPDVDFATLRLEQSGMTPNDDCKVTTWPPSVPGKAPKAFHLVSARTQLPIIQKAALNNRTLGELPKETPANRVERLRASLENATEERDAIIEEQQHFMRSHSYKEDVLKAAYAAVGNIAMGAAYASIPVGDHAVVAIQLRGGNATDRIFKSLTLHIKSDSRILAYAAPKSLAEAMQPWKEELSPLYNQKGVQGKMPCWMDANANGVAIGTLTRRDTEALRDHHGRSVVSVDLRINLPNGTAITILQQNQATRTGEVDVHTLPSADDSVDVHALPSADGSVDVHALPDSEATGPDPSNAANKLPSITIPIPCPRNKFLSLFKILATFDKVACAAVTVLRIGEPLTYNQRFTVPMEIRIDAPITKAGVYTTLAGRDIVNLHSSINADNCTLFISGISNKDRNEAAELVDPSTLWWRPAQATKQAYNALPELSKQMTTQPSATVIVAAKKVPNFRRDMQVWVVKTEDGRVWRFKSPQSTNTNAFTLLREGNDLRLQIDTDAWTVRAATAAM